MTNEKENFEKFIKENPKTKIVLNEMCKRVNVKFEDVKFWEPEWYCVKEWTEEEQNNYKKWLIDFMANDAEARRELMERPLKDKRSLEKFASWFMLDYSWKSKNNG